MKTTFDLPDDLIKAIKIRAVEENRRIKDVVAEALRRGLRVTAGNGGAVHRRVQLPLVDCVHEARTDEEITPDRVAAILESDEVAAYSGTADDAL